MRQRRERAEDNFAHRGIQKALLNAKARVKRGAKLFVPEGRTTHKVINDVQRSKGNRPVKVNANYHGLR